LSLGCDSFINKSKRKINIDLAVVASQIPRGAIHDILLYLEIVSLNSVLEKRGYSSGTILGISSRKNGFKGQFSAELYDLSSVFHRRSKEVHGAPLYLIVSMARLDFFRVHAMRSHGRLLKEAISVILLSKKMRLACLIELLNVHQSFRRPLFLYV